MKIRITTAHTYHECVRLGALSDLYERPELYDRLCPRLHVDAPEVVFWADQVPQGGRILELACGTGRVAIPLAQRGHSRFSVCGLDRCLSMLDVARRDAPSLTWVAGDMCEIQPELAAPFDLVFCTLNAFLHLEDRVSQEAFFRVVRHYLRDGGVFGLCIVNPDVRAYARGARVRHRLMNAADLTVDETVVYDHARQTARNRYHFARPGEPDFFVARADLRAVYPEELLALLHYNGFVIQSRFGDFDATRFHNDSPLQVVLASPR